MIIELDQFIYLDGFRAATRTHASIKHGQILTNRVQKALFYHL